MSEPLIESLIALSGNQNVVVIHKPFVQFTGTLEAAVLLSQLLYWTPRSTLPDGWIAKTDASWSDELCLTKYAIRKARSTLETMGVLETQRLKFDGAPTVHYRLVLAVLQEKWILWIRQNDLLKTENPIAETAQSLTETTTETTTENNLAASGTSDNKHPEQSATPQTPPGNPLLPQPPSSFDGWLALLHNKEGNRTATLRWMIETVYPNIPDCDLPAYSYVGSVAKRVGGAARLAELIWQNSTRPPTGNVLNYLQAIHKHRGNTNGGNTNATAKGRNGQGFTSPYSAEEIAQLNAEAARRIGEC